MKFLKIITVILLTCNLVSCKKKHYNGNEVKIFEIKSSINGNSYDVWVIIPENYKENEKHRVLYFLDREWDFDLFYKASKKCGNGKYYSDLLVGIGWGNSSRESDYTPTLTSYGQGKADEFIEFIKKDLFSYMELHFNADTTRNSRCIAGHSFGGLFTAYCFVKHPSIFGNYLALSPSLWYDEQVVLRIEEKTRNQHSYNSLIYSSVGGTESGGMLPVFSVWKEAFNSGYPTVKKNFEIIQGQGHEGSKRASIENGLKYYFTNR